MTARVLAAAALALAGGGCGLVGYGDDGGQPDAACYSTIAIGDDHACVANRAGAVYCWGADDHGQSSGTAGGAGRPTPVRVTLPSAAYLVAAGPSTTCAITDDSQVYCWGARKGSLGLPDYGAPTVVDVGGPAYRIGLGEGYACAKVGPDDHAACWGFGGSQRLGQPDEADHLTPVTVAGPTALAGLSVGQRTACALQGDGQIWCWGDNRSGQLGIGSTAFAQGPTVVPALTGSEAVAIGEQLACALDDDRVSCWGANDLGQLGEGTVGAPVRSPGQPLATDVASLAVMASAACLLHWDGTVRCWGQNRAGQLATGDLAIRPSPVSIDVLHGARALAGGYQQACAEKDDSLLCWGSNLFGQLGRGSVSMVPVPRPLGAGTTWATVRGGGGTLCAIDAGQQLWCWGDGEHGQAALGAQRGAASPVMIRGGVLDVGLGVRHGCARGATTLWCWGDNGTGQLGDPTLGARALDPRPIIDAVAIDALAVGDAHTCAVAGGTLKCWGNNGAGQLGDGTLMPRNTPQPIGLPGVTRLAAGSAHTCAIDDMFRVWCWGAGGAGQLGDGLVTSSSVPVAVPHPGGGNFVAIAAGREHTCALDQGRNLWCWGSNVQGQLGAAGASPTPRLVGWAAAAGAVSKLHVGRDTTCAVLITGEARCWGGDPTGVLGGGNSTMPRTFATLSDVATFGGGPDTLCGITLAGDLFCAGAGDRGAVGSDFVGWTIAPVPVPCD